MAKLIYVFEDISEADLSRTPLAALRAMRLAGVTLSRAGWLSMSAELRRDLVLAGAADAVELSRIQKLMNAAPIREMKLIASIPDPPTDEVPQAVGHALGPGRSVSLELWRALSGLDRYVLALLANNTRLFWRALQEMALSRREVGQLLPSFGWTGTLARAEVRMSGETLTQLRSPLFMDGRAFVLARVAGIRAARWASEILDLHAANPTGAVELGHSFDLQRADMLVWQAHVSTVEGQFSPSASLLAVATASAALADMLTRAGSTFMIESIGLSTEPWRADDTEDDVTIGV
ncbi:MAG: hypothetical protein IPI67_29125 [Myxococcales bacterium]|nr:hypothetical protein [Myxococcales bacterium]